MRRTFVLFSLLLFALTSYSQAPSGRIVVGGSESMIVLAQHWAKLYGVDPVDVTAMGTSASLSGLAGGTTGVVQSIRALSTAESAAVAKDLGAPPLAIKVGVEAVAVVVHPANPVSKLTLRQLRDIYVGRITDWKEVGGKPGRIQLYSTESAVGGSLFFREAVLGAEEFDTTMRGFANSKSMADAVAADPNGIGFGNVSVLTNTKGVRIAAGAAGLGVEPTSDNLRTARYPVSRYLFWILAPKPNPPVRRFASWVLSHDGQLVVESLGYYPLTPEDRATASAKVSGSGGSR